MPFSSKEIVPNTIGGILKQARLSQGWELTEVAKKTGIEVKYLDFLEADDFYKLPGPTYTKGFLKRYAEFLNLSAEKIIEQWEKIFKKDKILIEKPNKPKKFRITELSFRTALILVFIVFVFLYLGLNIRRILSVPKIEIIFPAEDLVVKESSITIKGKTDKGTTEVFINGRPIEQNNNYFEQKIDLLPGINTIEISAKKKYSKSVVVQRKIVVE